MGFTSSTASAGDTTQIIFEKVWVLSFRFARWKYSEDGWCWCLLWMCLIPMNCTGKVDNSKF